MRFTFLLIALILFDVLVISSVLLEVPEDLRTPQQPVVLHKSDADPGSLLPATASGAAASVPCRKRADDPCSQYSQNRPAK